MKCACPWVWSRATITLCSCNEWADRGQTRKKKRQPRGWNEGPWFDYQQMHATFVFFQLSRWALGPTKPPILWVSWKRPGRGKHSPPSGAKVKNECTCNSISSYAFMARKCTQIMWQCMRPTGLEFDRTRFTFSQKKRFSVPENSQWGRSEHLLPQWLRVSTEAVNVLSRRARMLDPGKMEVVVSYHTAPLLPCRWAQYLHSIQSMQPPRHPVKATLFRDRILMTYYSSQFDCTSESLLYNM
jgi:hypothetical protein